MLAEEKNGVEEGEAGKKIEEQEEERGSMLRTATTPVFNSIVPHTRIWMKEMERTNISPMQRIRQKKKRGGGGKGGRGGTCVTKVTVYTISVGRLP